MSKLYYIVGPASVEIPEELFAAGTDGVRLTFSFGTPEIQLKRAVSVHAAAAKHNVTPVVIADLEGGGARVGEINPNTEEERFPVAADEMVLVQQRDAVTIETEKVIPVPDETVFASLAVGDVLVVGDGGAELVITEAATTGFTARALFAGVVESRRGLFVHSQSFAPVCLTEKDKADLAHIAQHDEYTHVALSFVSSVADVEEAKAVMAKYGGTQRLVAKIETKPGVEHIEAICAAVDEVMVARGDLALALPWYEMPAAVDTIVAACQKTQTPFIMATQVAEGMLHGNSLTRAEMTDLWHWQQAGMDGVLLSRETAWGERPAGTIKRVKKLIG